ncbi:MAG: RNA methyltransferase [Desulfatiglandales bacterium]
MIVKEIVSKNNVIFKKFLKVLKGRGIKKYGLTFLSGPKQVKEVLRDFPGRCMGIVLSKDQSIPEGGISEGMTIYHLGSDLFQDVDIYGTDQPLLLVRVEPFPPWTIEHWPSGCTLFVPFQDPANVGAVMRSAAAFGVSGVVILREAAHPYHHKSLRAAGSAAFRIPIFQGPSIRELGGTKVPMIALSPEGEDIARCRFPSTFGLLPGLEGPGLPRNLRTMTTLAIPMESGVESINAALATGIALYLWRRNLKEGARHEA